jgi:hypothetical protein
LHIPVKEIKEVNDFFTNYESYYPFDRDKSMNTFKKIVSEGRMKMYEGFFLWFSDYHSLYENTFDILMNEDNYIPITWKYYIAIMAVSTIRCEYLYRELEIQFLLKGGDEQWIVSGLVVVPEKLKMLQKINNILAHQPWKLKIQDINELCNKYETNGWSLNELTRAVLIMTNYHKLASVVESMRLDIIEYIDENEMKIRNDQQKKSEDSKILKYINEGNVKKIIISELEDINKSKDEPNTDPIRKFSDENKNSRSKYSSPLDNLLASKDFTKHISTYCTVYLDFDSHSEEYNSYIVIILLIIY